MKKLLLFALLLTPCAFAQDRRPHLAGTGSPLLQTPIPACTAGDIYVDTITGDTYTAKGYPCTWQLKGAGTVQGVSNDCTGSGSGTIPVTCTKTNGVSFAPSATTDATNAANISAGTIPDARFTAKTNCSDPTKVYSPAAGACIAAGGTPSGANSVLQLANTLGTAFSSDSTISADTVNHNVIAPQLNGFTYAGPAQTGGGSNGIINSLGSGKTVIAEPTYNGETGLNWFNWNFSSANNYHLHRTLGGQDLDFFSNWVPASSPLFGNTNNTGHSYFFIDTSSSGTAKNTHAVGIDLQMYDTAPGYSAGSTGLLDAGWKVSSGLAINHNTTGAGIAESFGITQNKSGEGDNAGVYVYTNGTGGWTTLSDEGTKAGAFQTNEVACAYRGTIAASGTGLTNLATTPTQLNGCQGTGKKLIDIGQGGGLDVAPYSGTVTNIANVTVGPSGLTDVTLSGTVPVSNAWGTINANVNPAAGSTSNSPYTTSVTFNVTITSGAFDNTHVLCFGGGQHDCNVPTSVGTPSGGIVSITMPVRMSHPSGVPVMQGGLASSGLELPYFDYVAAGIKMRYLLDCIGSTSANTARCTIWKAGNATSFGGGSFNDVFKSIPMTTLSNSGTTTVAFAYTTANLPHPERFNAATLLISGASDSAFNTLCTAAAFNVGALTGTCTISGLSGTHTAVSASAVPAGPQNTGNNAYKIWPQARVLDVQDYAATPITSNGKLLVEPNGITFASGDTLEVPNHESANFNGMTVANNPLNPYIQVANGIAISMQGSGVTGTTNLLSVTNNNGDALYQEFGGSLSLPTMVKTTGAFATGLKFDHLPTVFGSSDALINIPTIPTIQQNDTNLNAPLFFIAGKSGNYQQTWAPFTNTLTDSTTGPRNFNASANNFPTGPVTISTVLHVNGAGAVIATNETQIDRSAGVSRLWSFGNDATHYGGWMLNSEPGTTATSFTWLNCPIYVVGATIPACAFGSPISVAGQTSGAWTLKTAAATTSYTSTAPAAVCASGQSWQTVDAAGTWGCVTLAPLASPTFTGTVTAPAATVTGALTVGSCTGCGSITTLASSETVTFSATPTFSTATRYSTITLTANITSFTLASGSAGQEKTLTFCQNGTGGFTVAGPANVHGLFTNGTTASKCSSQHFSYDSVQTAWLADSPGVINE